MCMIGLIHISMKSMHSIYANTDRIVNSHYLKMSVVSL